MTQEERKKIIDEIIEDLKTLEKIRESKKNKNSKLSLSS